MNVPSDINFTQVHDLSQISCDLLSPELLAPNNLQPTMSPDEPIVEEEVTLYQQSQLQFQPEEISTSGSTMKVRSAKLIVPASLVTMERNKQSPNGLVIITKVLETANRLGYDNCLVNKKRGPFFQKFEQCSLCRGWSSF